MSQRSIDNAVIKAVAYKLDKMEMTIEELENNKKLILDLSMSSQDDRVRFNATKLLTETEMKIAELRWKMFEHDNPAIQKQEIVHKIDKIEIELLQKAPQNDTKNQPT